MADGGGWTAAPCGCRFRARGAAFVIRPCSPGCTLWQYARAQAGMAGKPMLVKVAADADVLPGGPGPGVTAARLPFGHGWRECRPAVLGLPGAAAADEAAVAGAWSSVPDTDRQLFHQLCCLGRQGDEQLAAAERVAAVMRGALKVPGGPGGG